MSVFLRACVSEFTCFILTLTREAVKVEPKAKSDELDLHGEVMGVTCTEKEVQIVLIHSWPQCLIPRS